MKISKQILSLSIAVSAVVGIMYFQQTKTSSCDSEMMLANIEALTAEEESNCHYQNGYRKWYTEAKSSYSRKEQFYDCCEKLQEGYDPSGTCN